ncbi:MAG: BatA domain-containing protein, partial [Planctomycetota bacterium]
MTFGFPWALLGLVPVTAVAILALLRPARRRLTVPSLRWWLGHSSRRAPAARRRSRRAVLSWLLLLLGAVSAVLAGAQPVVRTQAPRRYLAIAVVNSAELHSPDATDALHRSAAALLSRLSPADRVQLLLPETAGGASEPMSPSQARSRIENLT